MATRKKTPARKRAAGSARKKSAARKAARRPAKSTTRKAPARRKAATKVKATKQRKATPAKKRPAKATKSKPAKKSRVPATTRRPAAVPARRRVKPVAVSRPALPDPGVLVDGKVVTEAEIRRMPDKAYMNVMQLSFFRQRLLQMRNEVVHRELDVKERLHQREVFADPADRATAEEEHWLDLRLRERESLLLRKIDEALRRIRDREYGYCEVTGESIGIPRLIARPTATVCVDVKGQNEQIESQFRDR